MGTHLGVLSESYPMVVVVVVVVVVVLLLFAVILMLQNVHILQSNGTKDNKKHKKAIAQILNARKEKK